jgi:hypothetical protein
MRYIELFDAKPKKRKEKCENNSRAKIGLCTKGQLISKSIVGLYLKKKHFKNLKNFCPNI